ncbi:MAG: hypothetical protein ACTSYJ_01285 [Candidatus Thorarchaeota archaeon]
MNPRILARMEMIEFEIDSLRRYISELSKALNTSTEEFASYVETYANELSEEERDDWYDWNSDKHWDLTEKFPKLLNNSLFVTIYSCMESNVYGLSKRFEKSTPHNIELKDLKGKGIKLYQTYLKKVQGVDFPDTSSAWNRIKLFQKVRNFIVHSNGKLDSSKNDDRNAKIVIEYVRDNPDMISLDKYAGIIISEKCNAEFIEVIQSFLLDLFERASRTKRV